MLQKGAESLPNKVAHDYKQLAKLYDAKNYKKGLKNAEKILQSHPDHPETNAMKALFQLELGDQAKAQVTAKFALLKSMMKSMFCWHTYGSVHKKRKNYIEAAKCFEQALKFQKDNMQILRQAASLQIQIRDHASHVNTRWKIVSLKPNIIHHWVGFAVAQHLKGDFEQLYKALSSIDNMRLSIEMKPVQLSHYFIYRAIAFRDGQKFDKMYDQLKKNKQKILDEDIWHELMFKCSKKLGKKEQADASIEFLVKKYPQNNEYISKYQRHTKLSARDLYKKLIDQYNSKIAKIYELTVIQDKQQFKDKFSKFIKPFYQKNLISLYSEIQIVYERSPFVNVIEEVFQQFQTSLKENRYPDGSQAVFPTQYLWSLYILSQHHSRKFQTLKLAHDYICKAMNHTNTVSQFYTVKAEIEYKMHNNLQSLKTINEARKTDLADRYMNNICIKYLMKMMKPNIAEDVLKLFMRDQISLYDLQNQWYIIEAGKSFLKMRKFEPGLRHLNFIQKQFIQMDSNQIDFHSYCLRKWTLREYIEYIAFNDNIYHDKKYAQAAAHAIQNLFEYVEYLKNMPKQKAEEKKQQQQPKKKKKKKNKANQVEELPPAENSKKRIDYDGKQYAQKIKKDPLAEAYIYAKNIVSAKYYNKNNRNQNQKFAFAFSQALRIFIHMNKPLLAIKAHKKLMLTNHDPYLLHLWTIKIADFLKKTCEDQKAHQLIKINAKQYIKQKIGELSITQYHNSCIDKLPNNPLSIILKKQLELALIQKDTRDDLIKLYKNQLQDIMKDGKQDLGVLQRVFYVVHKLEFYGQFDQNHKQVLNKQFGQHTTYFTKWFEQIDKLPDSTWSMFWLSDFDIKREEQMIKKAEQKKQKEK